MSMDIVDSVGETKLQELQSAVRGRLIRPGDPDYDSARRIYNAAIEKTPALIVRCSGVSDVMRAVEFSRAHNLLLAVRGGGHNVAGNALCDGGVVIDLCAMKGVRVDPARRTARAQGGVTWGELDHETQAFGLATTGGVVTTTGIAGLTLGGGLGYLMRKHGLACDNLLSADLVTADGRFLTAGRDQNEDLFWGLRGGGGNFGIATSFEYRLHPVGSVLAGAVMFPIANARDVLRLYRECTSRAPDELTAYAGFLTSPDGVQLVATIACWSGAIEAGEEAVRPFRELGHQVADTIAPIPYRGIQTLFDPAYPSGLHNYWVSNFLRELSDEAIETIIGYCETVPSALSAVAIEHLGGAVARVGKTETAFHHRDSPYNLIITSLWRDAGDSEKNIRWTRELHEAMRPFGPDAVYVNYLGDEGEGRVKAAYGPNYERLVELKNKYDPANVFRLNQNIRPTVARPT
jgi:FAD/FMN-containing dehydrogenase